MYSNTVYVEGSCWQWLSGQSLTKSDQMQVLEGYSDSFIKWLSLSTTQCINVIRLPLNKHKLQCCQVWPDPFPILHGPG